VGGQHFQKRPGLRGFSFFASLLTHRKPGSTFYGRTGYNKPMDPSHSLKSVILQRNTLVRTWALGGVFAVFGLLHLIKRREGFVFFDRRLFGAV
jgi:hypothetical protein